MDWFPGRPGVRAVYVRAVSVLIVVAGFGGCAPVIDNLPEGAPRGYVECRWQSNPGFPLKFSLSPASGAGAGVGSVLEEVPVYRSRDDEGKIRFVARPGPHTLTVSSIGDAESMSILDKGSNPLGALPANERERVRVEVPEGMTTVVTINFKRQDTWSDWVGRDVPGTFMMVLSSGGPVAEPQAGGGDGGTQRGGERNPQRW